MVERAVFKLRDEVREGRLMVIREEYQVEVMGIKEESGDKKVE